MTSLPPEDVQSYPRPPLCEPVPQQVRAVRGGVEIVRSDRVWRVCETHHPPTYYLPPDDVRMDLFVANPRRSWCEWKGRAAYWDIAGPAGTVAAAAAAWSYPDPTRAFAAIRDHLAIYAWALDQAWVGDTAVIPQPGDFYGGWVTPNLTGRIKGPPGTEGW